MSSQKKFFLVALAAAVSLLAFSPGVASAVETGSISGTVTNASIGPVPGMCALAYDGDGTMQEVANTASNGTYSLTGLPAGDYRVEFKFCGNTNVVGEFYDDKQTLAEANSVSVTAGTDTPGINAELATGGKVSGTVTGITDGPLDDICVRAFDSNGERAGTLAHSDSSGFYTVTALGTGDYRMTFYDCGGNRNLVAEYYDDKASLAQATPVSVTAGLETQDIDAQLATGGTISGTVTGGYGNSLGGTFCVTSVTAYDSNGVYAGYDNPDSNGNYLIDRLGTGDYRLEFRSGCGQISENEVITPVGTVFAEFYDDKASLEEATPVSVTAGENTEHINAHLGSGPVPGFGTISGKTTDSTGDQATNVCVNAYDSSGEIAGYSTMGNGNYTVGGLPTGNYRLRFYQCGDWDADVVTEYYKDKETLADATPVAVVDGADTPYVNAQLGLAGTDDFTPPPDSTVYKAAIGKVTVKGPVRLRRGKKAIHKITISNSGNIDATGVALRVKGRGVNFRSSVGSIPAGDTRTVKARLKPNRSGKVILTFKVTSSNAGGTSVRRGITVVK